jgi:hypothetical protein
MALPRTGRKAAAPKSSPCQYPPPGDGLRTHGAPGLSSAAASWVAFGTSGTPRNRVAEPKTFNEDHILATTQGDLRLPAPARGAGPLFVGHWTLHATSRSRPLHDGLEFFTVVRHKRVHAMVPAPRPRYKHAHT